MKLPTTFYKGEDCIHAIVETPNRCGAKYDFDQDTEAFILKKILPAGMTFPFPFGFIPHTKAEDGDPLDVLILLDETTFPGCVFPSRIIGVMEASETKDGKTNRNDRIIGTAIASEKYKSLLDLSALDPYLGKQLENFFNTYTNLEKKEFKAIAKKGPETAIHLIKKQMVKNT